MSAHVFLDRVWLFNLLQCFASATGGRKFCSVWKCCIRSCISHLQSHKRVFVESSATSKFDNCSCFQTRSDSSAYCSVSMLKLMRQSFVACGSTASPLACPTSRSTNKSLQRELCHIEVWWLLIFSDQVWLFCLLQCFAGATGERKFQSIWNYYIPSCIPHWQIHKQISTERALPHRSSVYNHGFFFFLRSASCAAELELSSKWGNFKKTNAPCTKG